MPVLSQNEAPFLIFATGQAHAYAEGDKFISAWNAGVGGIRQWPGKNFKVKGDMSLMAQFNTENALVDRQFKASAGPGIEALPGLMLFMPISVYSIPTKNDGGVGIGLNGILDLTFKAETVGLAITLETSLTNHLSVVYFGGFMVYYKFN